MNALAAGHQKSGPVGAGRSTALRQRLERGSDLVEAQPDVAGGTNECEAPQHVPLETALAALGRTGKLEDRLVRLRAPSASLAEDWADSDETLRRLFTRLFCERVGIPLLPGDEDEVC